MRSKNHLRDFQKEKFKVVMDIIQACKDNIVKKSFLISLVQENKLKQLILK